MIPGAIYGFRNDKSENWGPDTFVGYHEGDGPRFICREQDWNECSHNNTSDTNTTQFDNNTGEISMNEVLTARIQKIQEVLGAKDKEYGINGNRLHNFDVAARIGNTNAEQALKGMWMKHIVSVFDMIDAPETITIPMIDEKLGDMINYGLLLRQMFNRITPFDDMLEDALERIKHYDEYQERLKYIEDIARMGNTTPELALKGMLLGSLHDVFSTMLSGKGQYHATIDNLIRQIIMLEYIMLTRILSNVEWESGTPEAQADEFLGGCAPMVPQGAKPFGMPHYEDAKQMDMPPITHEPGKF